MSLENFLAYCDDMYVAEEGLVETKGEQRSIELKAKMKDKVSKIMKTIKEKVKHYATLIKNCILNLINLLRDKFDRIFKAKKLEIDPTYYEKSMKCVAEAGRIKKSHKNIIPAINKLAGEFKSTADTNGNFDSVNSDLANLDGNVSEYIKAAETIVDSLPDAESIDSSKYKEVSINKAQDAKAVLEDSIADLKRYLKVLDVMDADEKWFYQEASTNDMGYLNERLTTWSRLFTCFYKSY